MSEEQTAVTDRLRRFRSLPEEATLPERETEIYDPTEAFSERHNGKVTEKFKR